MKRRSILSALALGAVAQVIPFARAARGQEFAPSILDPQGGADALRRYAPWLDPALSLRDYHIHLRGGMTAEMAFARAKLTGVKSGVLENVGREWPLYDNERLDAFVADVERLNESLAAQDKLKIGIQVNDRDWFEKIDPNVYARLDYVLADTMIMGKRHDGSDERLWLLPKDYDVDREEWFERYFNHCLTVVSEPIDVLANPTYLPDFIADRWDALWTREKMATLIQAAIDANVALEIQAESAFPKPKFIRLALDMGAKLSFGTNNFDPKLKNLATWKKAIDDFDLKPENLWRDYRDPSREPVAPRQKPAAKRKLDLDAIRDVLFQKNILH